MSGRRYAEGTTVTPERSQMEISELLRRYGADGFQYGWEGQRAAVAFKAHGRMIRFLLDLPDPGDREFALTPTKQTRSPESRRKAYEGEVRRRWRALALAIKAKLEAVETGIASFEDEFLAYTVLPDGTTVGEHVHAEVDAAWRTGGTPPRLIGMGGDR